MDKKLPSKLSAPQQTLFAEIVAAGPDGKTLYERFPPLLKLIEYGLVGLMSKGTYGHDRFTFVDPGNKLRKFVTGGLLNDLHRIFLVAHGYIAYDHGMWHLTDLGKTTAEKLGYL